MSHIVELEARKCSNIFLVPFRSTAKKFLAAANFLEVLRIFPKVPISESVRPVHCFLRFLSNLSEYILQSEEKIKYSKWKAADIAKAFREGRRPNPGPAGSGIDTETPLTVDTSSGSPPPTSPVSPPSSTEPPSQSQGDTSVSGRRPDTSPPTNGKTSPKRSSPPPSMSAADIARANMAPREFQTKTPPRPGVHVVDGESSPGSWSTAATPGTDDRTKGTNGFGYGEQDTPIRKKEPGRGNSRLRSGWVSGELEGVSDGSDEGIANETQKRTVRFTPSVTGGLSPPVTPGQAGQTQPFVSASQPPAPAPPSNSINMPFTVGHTRSSSGSSLANSNAVNRGRSTSVSSSLPTPAGTPRASGPQPLASSPPSSYRMSANTSAPPPLDAPSSPQDLTPQQIAKAQKHCRFAISALDYEDADQARKELRAALAVLGSQA